MGASDRESIAVKTLTPEYATTTLTFTAQGSTDNGRLEIVGYGKGAFRIGAVSLMPADNIQGWRVDTLARLRELDSPVYRWPGGNFVSGYDWKDGIGDRDRRPPRKNPAWKGIESNDVGIDEFMVLVRELGTEPYIAVNTGLGGIESAAEEVQYLNGAATTPMGKRRADNGHAKPYGVKWWGIGNEMYGDWQLGHMPLSEYVKKHNRVVDAMRAVDPKIVPIAVGAVGDWTKEMLTQSVAHMELLSEHTYWQSKPDVPAHVEQAVVAIRQIADAHRAYRKALPSLKGKDIRIALDEWNYWYGPNEYGELGTRYFLQDGLGAAAALHEMFRNSDIFFMANYAQTVNVIGAIKTTPTAAEMEPTGLVQQLYRARFGVTPVEVAGDLRPLGRRRRAQRRRPRPHRRRGQSHRRGPSTAVEGRGADARRLRPEVGHHWQGQVGPQPARRPARRGHHHRRGGRSPGSGRGGAAQRDALLAVAALAGGYHFSIVSECLGNV